MGELGMRKVLFEDVAELGNRAGLSRLLFVEGPADPNTEAGPPDGVEGWAICSDLSGHARAV